MPTIRQYSRPERSGVLPHATLSRKPMILAVLLLFTIPLLARAQSNNAQDPRVHLYTGADIVRTQKELNELYGDHDKDASFLRDLGLAVFLKGQPEKAAEYFRQSIEYEADVNLSAGICCLFDFSPMLITPVLLESLAALSSDIWDRRETHPCAARSALRALQDYRDLQGVSNPNQMRLDMDAVMDWRVIGPFENVSNSGWNRVFEVEDLCVSSTSGRIQYNGFYTGEDGRECSWFTPDVYGGRSYIALESYYPDFENSVYYAANNLKMRSACTATVWLRVSGFFKLWINGELAAMNPIASSPDFLQRFEVDLSKGANHLLLKIGGSPTEPGFEFSLVPGDKREEHGDDRPLSDTIRSILDDDANEADEQRVSGANTSNLDDLLTLRDARGVILSSTEKALLSSLGFDPQADACDWVADLSPHEAFWRGVNLIPLGKNALGFIEACLERWPESSLFEYLRLVAGNANGWNSRAPGLAESLCEREPECDLFRCVFALILQSRCQFGKALDVLLAGKGMERIQFPVTSRRPAICPLYTLLLHKALMVADELDEAARVFVYLDESYENIAEFEQVRAENSLLRLEVDDAISHLEEAVRLQPANEMLFTQLVETLRDFRPEQADLLLKKNAGLFPHSDWAQRLEWNDVLKANNSSKVIAHLQRMHDSYPLETPWTEILSWSYMAAYHALSATRSGESKIVKSLRGQALNYLSAILARDPYRLDVYKKKMEIQGVQTIWEALPEQAFHDFFETAPTGDEYPGDDGVILLEDTRRLLLLRQATWQEYYLVGKVFTDAGADRFTSIFPPIMQSSMQSVESVEIASRKPGGEIREGRLEQGHVLFDGLSAGDMFYIHITLQGTPFLDGAVDDVVFLQHDLPVEEASYTLAANKPLQIDLDDQGFAVEHDTRTVPPFFIQTWRLKDLPAVFSEPHAVPLEGERARIRFNNLSGWSQVVDWYQRLSGDRTFPDRDVIEKVREVCGDAADTETGMRRVFEFVCDDIAYKDLYFQYSAHIPEYAGDVLRAGMGDCKDKAALLIAMLREIGVPADFVLAAPRRWPHPLRLPGFKFNHAFVRAYPPDGEAIWLDPTTPGNTYGHITEPYQGGRGLLIAAGETEALTFPHQSGREDHVCEAVLDLREDGSARLEVEHRLSGDFALSYRNLFLGQRATRTRILLNEVLHVMFGNVELLEFAHDDPRSIDDDWRLSYALELPDCVVASGDRALLSVTAPLHLDYALKVPVRGERRRSALCSDVCGRERVVIEVRLPKGMKVEALPDPIRENGKFLEWWRYCEMRETGFLVRWDARLKPVNGDAAGIDDFREMAARIDTATPLVVMLTGSAD